MPVGAAKGGEEQMMMMMCEESVCVCADVMRETKGAPCICSYYPGGGDRLRPLRQGLERAG